MQVCDATAFTLPTYSGLRPLFSKKLQDSLTMATFPFPFLRLTARRDVLPRVCPPLAGGCAPVHRPSGLTALLSTQYSVATAVSVYFLGLRVPGFLLRVPTAGFGNAGFHRLLAHPHLPPPTTHYPPPTTYSYSYFGGGKGGRGGRHAWQGQGCGTFHFEVPHKLSLSLTLLNLTLVYSQILVAWYNFFLK